MQYYVGIFLNISGIESDEKNANFRFDRRCGTKNENFYENYEMRTCTACERVIIFLSDHFHLH